MRESCAGEVVQVACGESARRDLAQAGSLCPAAIERARAAGMEMASGGRRERRGNLAADRHVAAMARIDAWHLLYERDRIRMVRPRIELGRGTGLDDAPEVHDDDSVGDVTDHAEI